VADPCGALLRLLLLLCVTLRPLCAASVLLASLLR
jgi:hypothetical protein